MKSTKIAYVQLIQFLKTKTIQNGEPKKLYSNEELISFVDGLSGIEFDKFLSILGI